MLLEKIISHIYSENNKELKEENDRFKLEDIKLVEKCPKCEKTLVKDSKEKAYWCPYCEKYYSYEQVKK